MLESVSVCYDVLMVIYISLHVSVLVALSVMVGDGESWVGVVSRFIMPETYSM